MPTEYRLVELKVDVMRVDLIFSKILQFYRNFSEETVRLGSEILFPSEMSFLNRKRCFFWSNLTMSH